MQVTVAELIDACERLGYRIFKGELNLNLLGVRHKDVHSNAFNDLFCVLYQQNGIWQLEQFSCTTDPGTYYRETPANVDGTAIVVPMQHRSLWTFGMHQGKYEALVQNRAVTVYRDNNHDTNIDTDVPMDTGYFGINCHRAGLSESGSVLVDRWSAGCQVLARADDFDRVMHLCRSSAAHWGSTFTYTLLTQQQLENTNGQAHSI